MYFTALYFGGVLKLDRNNMDDGERDRLILSAGHIVPVLYAALAHGGYISIKELDTLRKINSRLQGHPHYKSLPGIENSAGTSGARDERGGRDSACT